MNGDPYGGRKPGMFQSGGGCLVTLLVLFVIFWLFAVGGCLEACSTLGGG